MNRNYRKMSIEELQKEFDKYYKKILDQREMLDCFQSVAEEHFCGVAPYECLRRDVLIDLIKLERIKDIIFFKGGDALAKYDRDDCYYLPYSYFFNGICEE